MLSWLGSTVGEQFIDHDGAQGMVRIWDIHEDGKRRSKLDTAHWHDEQQKPYFQMTETITHLRGCGTR